MNRTHKLAVECAFTHAPKDIVEHLEEELIELLLSIKRWKRKKGLLVDVVEKACDVRTEIDTFFQLLNDSGNMTHPMIDAVATRKMDKFEKMLADENALSTGYLINRYNDPIEASMINN